MISQRSVCESLLAYGFQSPNMWCVGTSVWPDVPEPQAITCFKISAQLCGSRLLAILKRGFPVGPKNSVIWYLERQILMTNSDYLPSPGEVIKIDDISGVPSNFYQHRDNVDPELFHFEIEVRFTKPLPFKHMTAKEIDLDTVRIPAEEDFFSSTKVKKALLQRPKKWI